MPYLGNALRLAYCCLISAGLAPNAVADDATDGVEEKAGAWYLQAGSYAHYSDHYDYAGTPWFLGVEYHNAKGTITGLSAFNNSFDQFSQYLYWGRNFHPLKNHPNFRFKLTGGILHGYDGKHQNMSPVNWGDGWALGVVPGFGYQDGPLGVDVAFLSAAGVLFLVGYEF